ncbi:SDR family NAD(P)-dependent oxidoreductase [Nucisporomicrobium flavum]|jgi:enoyl-[acyl-carrier protein] reductase III|uniref:SDR family NAD(P)-dependent oxidoreductase n=1 Tax=Nucisporomicrobium flavum TaxID=2785915 RepID=UPI0018F51F2E|nr:SDR family oxidoreductase [Nucisporomicrobium flavum]
MTISTDDKPLDLAGKVALVTGATRGLGLAIARKLCLCGCEVIVNFSADTDAAEAAVRQLSGLGGKVEAIQADISEPADVSRLLEQIGRTYGRLDILVHNAGVFHPMRADDLRTEECGQDMAVALGPLLHGVGILGTMLPEGSGRIIAISSTGAHVAVPGYAGLAMAKAAVESLVRYLAVEFASRSITVNAVTVGKLDKGAAADPAGVGARIVARTPAGRLTRASDVADVVALLCRPEAAWIRGQSIVVDGGLSLTA